MECRSRGRIQTEVDVRTVITPEIVEFMETYHFWLAQGVMPAAGGLMDQALTWVEATRIMDSEFAKLRIQQQERELEAMRNR